jgi:tetratricopeptide (TPR) repeat protein
MDPSNKTSIENPDRWQRLWDIFHEAREKEASERDLYLNNACGSDKSLLQELKELLAAEDEADGVLEAGRVITRELKRETISLTKDAAPEFSAGKILADRFQIVDQIGQGGMGTVYKAIDLELRRQVALKFLDLDDPRWARRFLLEARFQARIEHDHICKVYEVGEVEGKQYIAMQFISGKTLLEAAPQLNIKQRVRLIQQVCNAVHAAHSIGVIHRDIKPTNILVGKSESGELIPYVTDFGLARELSAPGITSTGMVMGTAWYMSPEQARGEIRKLDLRCDIYALGATLYEVLCGKPPFDGNSTVEVLMKVINEEPTRLRQKNPEISADLETIVHKCLQKEPARRYESAAALSGDLQRFLDGEPILARPVTWSHRTIKRIKKYPAISGLIAASILIVISVALFAGWTWWHAKAQAELANEFEQEIRFMEDTARHAYTAPIHDVRNEEAIVEQRLKAIEKRMNEAGSVADGPGNFALGRGYMALYRYPEAKMHLERALNEYRIPRVAYSLGLTLGLMYPKEVERANQIGTKEEREEKTKQITKDFKEQALTLIKEGSAAIEIPEYVEGLIAYLDKKHDQALQKTQLAFQRKPWFFEAKKLEADVLRSMGREHRGSGDVKGAEDLFKKADAAYRAALQEGSSYWLSYGSLCALGMDRITMMLYQTGFPDEEVYKKSIEACDNSLKSNPDKPEAYVAKGALKFIFGSYQLRQGADPTANLKEAIALQKKASKWEWVRYAAYSNMAAAYADLSVYQRKMGIDEGESLKESIAGNREAVRLNPNSQNLRINFGISLAERANYETRMGRDAESIRDQAIHEFQEAVRIEPKFEIGYDCLGTIYLERAQSEFEQGGDPNSSTQLSIKNLRKAVEINPTFFLSYNNLGETYKLLARYAMEKNSDPTEFLNQAIQSFQKGLEINPDNLEGYSKLAGAYLIQAEAETNKKLDPSSYLSKATENIKRAEKLAADQIEIILLGAELNRTSARWKLSQGSCNEAMKQINHGLESVSKALNTNSKDANAHALKGELLLLQAQSSSSKQTAIAAQASFQEALRLNPKLLRKHSGSLQQAKEIAEL